MAPNACAVSVRPSCRMDIKAVPTRQTYVKFDTGKSLQKSFQKTKIWLQGGGGRRALYMKTKVRLPVSGEIKFT